MMRFSLALTIVFCLWSGSVFAQKVDPEWLNEDNWPAFVLNRPIEVTPDEDELIRLQKESYNACLDELRTRYVQWLQFHGSLKDVCDNADRLIALRLESGLSPANEMQLYAERLEFAKQLLQLADRFNNSEYRNVKNIIDDKFAHTYRMVAEKELVQLKKKQKADGPGDES